MHSLLLRGRTNMAALPVGHQTDESKQTAVQRMGDEAHDWPLDRTFHSTAEYSRVAKEVAKEMGVPCLDLFTILQEVSWQTQSARD